MRSFLLKNKVFLSLLAIFYSFQVVGISFSSQVSKNPVAVGERFSVTFSANGSIDKFSPPNLSNFSILSGPNQSSSMQWVNGNMSSSVSYSYILVAVKEGKQTIGSAKIEADGKAYSTEPIEMTVVKGDASAQQNQTPNQGQSQQAPPSSGGGSSAKDIPSNSNIFIKPVVNKSTAYLGEGISLSFKIYTRVSIVNSDLVKSADLNGFWNQEIKGDKVQWATETVNGIQYNVATIRQYILFPQKSGTLTIDPMEMDMVVQQKSSRGARSLFDQFFGGGIEEVQVKVKSSPLKINVLPLPSNKPASFTGAVGSFKVDLIATKNKLKADDATNIKVRVSGSGNINLVEAIKPSFPSDFETYEPKVNDQISTKLSGVSGSREFDYLVIPRHAGNFTIPGISFSYFDLGSKTYKTITTNSITLEVEKNGESSGNSVFSSQNKEEVKTLGNDIRYIHTEPIELKDPNNSFYGTWKFYTLLLMAPLLFLAAFLMKDKIQEELRNTAKIKSRNASKMANKHLKFAKKSLEERDTNKFYEDLSKALYGYVADKLNLELSKLDKDSIKVSLVSKNINLINVDELLKAIEYCDMARFAPTKQFTEQEALTNAETIINKIEEDFKV